MWLGLFALLLGSGAAAAEQENNAREILVRSLNASESVNYVGEQTTTIARGGQARESRQRVYRSGGRLRIEFIEPADDRGRVVVDDGSAVRVYMPRMQLILRDQTRTGRGASAARQREIREVLGGRVAVTMEQEDAVVAGRPAYLISVQPPGPPGRRRQLWIDREHYVPLRVREEMGGRVTDTRFTQIDFRASPPASLFRLQTPPGAQEIPADLGTPIPLARAREVAERWGGLFMPRDLSPRFRRPPVALRMTHEDEPVVVLVYSAERGGMTLSLFQTGSRVPVLRGRRAQMRGVNVVQTLREGVHLTLIGGLPEQQLRRILDSVQR